MKDEALRLALEALKTCQVDGDGWSGPHYWFDGEKVGKAIAAIKQALAQPEPEPVGEIQVEDMGRPFNAMRVTTHFYKEIPPVGTLLYTSPPKREPLTGGDERRHIICLCPDCIKS